MVSGGMTLKPCVDNSVENPVDNRKTTLNVINRVSMHPLGLRISTGLFMAFHQVFNAMSGEKDINLLILHRNAIVLINCLVL